MKWLETLLQFFTGKPIPTEAQITPSAPKGVASEVWLDKSMSRFFDIPVEHSLTPGRFEITHPSKSMLFVVEADLLTFEISREEAKNRKEGILPSLLNYRSNWLDKNMLLRLRCF